MSIEKLVPTFYKEYGKHINSFRMIPLINDGLLPVQRRLLYTLHLIAKNKFVTTATILGTMMGRFHPHSESKSTADWAVINEFADGEGAWGTNVGLEPIESGAIRYTSMKSNSRIEDIAFRFINDVEKQSIELEPEPIFLPTMLPFCLFKKIDYSNIAFGLSTRIPCYNPKDLIKRLMYLLNKRKKISIKPCIEGCDILGPKLELDNILTNGKGKIKVRGIIEYDPDNFTIYLKGKPPSLTFKTILSNINNYNGNKLLDDNHIVYSDLSSTETRIQFVINKLKNKQKYYDLMKEAIEASVVSNVSYEIYSVDLNMNVKQTSVDEFLMMTYNTYMATYSDHLENAINKNYKILHNLNIIEEIRKYISNALKKKDKDVIIKYLENKTKFTYDEIKQITEYYRIDKLFTVNIDREKIEELIKYYKSEQEDIDKSVENIYKDLYNIL